MKPIILLSTLLAGLTALSAQAIDIQRWTTPQGTQILLVERHELPIVDYAVIFKGAGSAAEPVGKSDIASPLASMMLRGTAKLNEEQFAERSNDLAARMSGSSSFEYSLFNFRSLSQTDSLNATAQLFGQALSQPRFESAVLKRLQNQAILSLKQAQGYPNYITSREQTRLNYGSHPYGKGAYRSEDSIRAVQLADLRQFHRQHYAQSNAIVLLVGDINRNQANALVRQTLSGLPKQPAHRTATPPVSVKGGRTRHLPFDNSEQASISIGLPVFTYNDPDYFALLVGNYVLGGGGFDSRLMKVLRDQYGYTYGASSSLTTYEQAGPFNISFTTQRKNSQAALAAAQKVLADFVEQGPTEVELKQAQDNITGGFVLNFDSNRKLLNVLIGIGLYQRPSDWLDTYTSKVKALTTDDIRRAWQKRIVPAQMNVVVTGEQSASESTSAKYSEVKLQ